MTGGYSAGREQEPANQPGLGSVPARQPRSNNKGAYFNGITLATAAAAAAKTELAVGCWCVLVWTLGDRAVTKSVMHLESRL